jgi:hypothetical protein
VPALPGRAGASVAADLVPAWDEEHRSRWPLATNGALRGTLADGRFAAGKNEGEKCAGDDSFAWEPALPVGQRADRRWPAKAAGCAWDGAGVNLGFSLTSRPADHGGRLEGGRAERARGRPAVHPSRARATTGSRRSTAATTPAATSTASRTSRSSLRATSWLLRRVGRRWGPGWSASDLEPALRCASYRLRVRHYAEGEIQPFQAAFPAATEEVGIPRTDDLDDLLTVLVAKGSWLVRGPAARSRRRTSPGAWTARSRSLARSPR